MRNQETVKLSMLGHSNALDARGWTLCFTILCAPLIKLLLHPHTGILDIMGSPLLLFIHVSQITIIELIFIIVYLLFTPSIFSQRNTFSAFVWVAILLWFFASLITLNSAPNKFVAYGKFIQYAVHILFAFSVISYLYGNSPAKPYVLKSIILSFFIFVPFFIFLIIFYSDPSTFNWATSLPGFNNVRHFAFYLSSSFIAISLYPLYNLNMTASRTTMAVFIIVLFAIWTTLCWTGSRALVASSCIAIASCYILFRHFAIAHRLFLTIFLVIIFGALASLFLPTSNPSFGLARFGTTVAAVGSLNDYSSGRVTFWTEALDVWQSSMWFGHGAGQAKMLIKSAAGQLVHLHNVLMQALLAWGLIGGAAFLTVIAGCIWSAWKNLASYPTVKTTAAAGFGILVLVVTNSLAAGTLYYPFPIFLFIIGAGLSCKPPINAPPPYSASPSPTT